MRLFLIAIAFLATQQLFNNYYFSTSGQLSGGEKTMEQFLDRLLHESVYDRRIRPFYKYGKGNYQFYYKFFNEIWFQNYFGILKKKKKIFFFLVLKCFLNI